MAKKKAAPKRAARYVVVTVNDGTTTPRVVTPVNKPTAGAMLSCSMNIVMRSTGIRRPSVGESVTITIHGTTKEGYIGGPGGLELPTGAKRGKR